MIKEILDDQNKKYEIYKEIQLDTPDGESVTVLQLDEIIYLDQLNSDIINISNEIQTLQNRLSNRQNILDQINNL